jgi:hypothetical protein
VWNGNPGGDMHSIAVSLLSTGDSP